jgi:hypothetical protein
MAKKETRVVQGIIKQVYNKELDKPDQFDNTVRLSVKVDVDGEEVWVSLGSKKFPGLSVKDGNDWVNVGAGSEVIIPCDVNGDYLNGKTSKVIVTNLVVPDERATAAPAQRPAATSNGSDSGTAPKTDWAKKDAGAAASSSVDKAIRILIATGEITQAGDEGYNLAQIKRLASDMQRIVTELRDEFLDGPPAAKPAPAAKRVGAPKSPELDDFEDEQCPF